MASNSRNPRLLPVPGPESAELLPVALPSALRSRHAGRGASGPDWGAPWSSTRAQVLGVSSMHAGPVQI